MVQWEEASVQTSSHLIPRNHMKTLGMAECACNPSAEAAETADPWGSLTNQASLSDKFSNSKKQDHPSPLNMEKRLGLGAAECVKSEPSART